MKLPCFPRIFSRLGPVLALSLSLLTCGGYDLFELHPREPGRRGQRVEFYGIGEYWHSDTIRFPNITVPTPDGGFERADVTLELDDTGMGGMGLGFSINDHWGLNAEFMFGASDYQASWQDSYLRGEMLMTSGKFNVDYYILAGRFTPFVTAGLGYFYFDTGIPSGPPDYYCWWDYWWGGYVCTGYVPTYTELDFTLNAGGGFRWDISDRFFLKAFAGATWVNMENTDWPVFIQAGLVVGAQF